MDYRFTALFNLQHVCFVLLAGICLYIAVVMGLAVSQTIAKVTSGIHTATTGASYMAICGIIYRAGEFFSGVGPVAAPLTSTFYSWIMGRQAPIALAAAPSYVTLLPHQWAAGAFTVLSAFKCLCRG